MANINEVPCGEIPCGSDGTFGAIVQGAQGIQGIAGVSASSLGFASFYALMPGDNASTVAVGAAIQFPQNGPTSGSAVTRLTSSTFNLAAAGIYSVRFQASIDEAGQLIVKINGVDDTHTVVGRATGTNQIAGDVLITTTTANSVISINNPSGNSTALTLTPLAGGTRPVSANVVIQRLT